MDTNNSFILYLKKSLYTGMEFKSKKNTYKLISINDNAVTILYYDRQEAIPFDLFYKVLMEDNKEMFL